jgi:hypothetical protein
VPLALAAIAGGAAVPAATAAETSTSGCLTPEVVGVDLAMARQALVSSGCNVQIRQLPAHGELVTPSPPDGRQLVARQRPLRGVRTPDVTLWLEPLCAQPAQPGPRRRGPVTSAGPNELISGLFVQGGPLQRAPHCRIGVPAGGVLTVSSASGGRVIARRSVRPGHYGIFPLSPGRYLLAGTLARAGGEAGPSQLGPELVTIARNRTTRLNVVVPVP